MSSVPPGVHEGPYICLVCRRGLEHEVFTELDPLTGRRVVTEEKWVHNGAQHADHEAVPTKELQFDDQVSVCDFCGVLHPTWMFPCSSFQGPLPGQEDVTRSYASIESWAACGACRDAIAAATPGRLEPLFDELWRRWMQTHGRELGGTTPKNRRELRRYIQAMWMLFMLNRSGEPVQLLTGELPPEP